MANPIVSHQHAVVYGIGLLHDIFINRSILLVKINTATHRLVQLIPAHEKLRSSMPTAAVSPDVISFWVTKTVGGLGPIGKRCLEQLRLVAGLLSKTLFIFN